MSDSEKHDMVLEALEELGAQNIQEDGDEIKHSCILPWGLHAHGDRSGSASVNWRKLAFNCFVCGGGSFFFFLAECKGESETAIRHWAEGKIDTSTEEGYLSLLSYIDECFHPKAEHDAPIPHFNPAVLDPWMKVHPYLTEIRHIPRENIVRHKIGYNADIDRIIIPVFWKGDLVGWQKRRLVNDGSPKYQNTPDFPRAKVLYNWDGPVGLPVIVESPMSVVSKSHLEGFQFIATFGKQVTDVQLRLLSQLNDVVLWFDNDAAGWSATSQVGEYLIRYTDVFVVDSPWNADAGDLDDDTALGLLEHHMIPFSLWTPPTVKEWKA
jgi:hypothetical protein